MAEKIDNHCAQCREGGGNRQRTWQDEKTVRGLFKGCGSFGTTVQARGPKSVNPDWAKAAAPLRCRSERAAPLYILTKTDQAPLQRFRPKDLHPF